MKNWCEFVDEPQAFGVLGTEYRRKFYAQVPGAPALAWQREQWQATICASCDHSAVWRDGVLVFPRVILDVDPPHPDMPAAAAALYSEAAEVLPVSRRAAAALARAAMESLLKELAPSAERVDLQTRIGGLRAKINPGLWQVLTALRVVGNDALHGGEDDLIVMYLGGDAAEVVEPFFGAINALVEELVTQPKRAAALYGMIPEPKRVAAERAADRGAPKP